MQNLIQYIKDSGLTFESLVEKSNIPGERINLIVSGVEEPNMSELRKLAKALKMDVGLLTTSNHEFQEINILFRNAVGNNRAKQKADQISHLVGNAFSLIDNTEGATSLFKNFRSLENTFENARVLAAMFRQLYYKGDFLEPILDLPRIITEELNCILFVFELGQNTDGASAIINQVPFIFISPRFEPRMLFTLAHELAHILSHHNPKENFAKIDSEIHALSRNKYADEGFANAFASELLMPEEGVGYALKSIRNHYGISGNNVGDVEIIILSRIYGVSFEVAAKRCEDLKLLPSGGAISLAEQIKKDFKSPEKRAEELRLAPRPRIYFPKVSPSLLESAINKVKNGEISIGKASEILTIPIAELIQQNSER